MKKMLLLFFLLILLSVSLTVSTGSGVGLTVDEVKIEWKTTFGRVTGFTYTITNYGEYVIKPDHFTIFIKRLDNYEQSAPLSVQELSPGKTLSSVVTLPNDFPYAESSIGDLSSVEIIFRLYDHSGNKMANFNGNYNLKGPSGGSLIRQVIPITSLTTDLSATTNDDALDMIGFTVNDITTDWNGVEGRLTQINYTITYRNTWAILEASSIKVNIEGFSPQFIGTVNRLKPMTTKSDLMTLTTPIKYSGDGINDLDVVPITFELLPSHSRRDSSQGHEIIATFTKDFDLNGKNSENEVCKKDFNCRQGLICSYDSRCQKPFNVGFYGPTYCVNYKKDIYKKNIVNINGLSTDAVFEECKKDTTCKEFNSKPVCATFKTEERSKSNKLEKVTVEPLLELTSSEKPNLNQEKSILLSKAGDYYHLIKSRLSNYHLSPEGTINSTKAATITPKSSKSSNFLSNKFYYLIMGGISIALLIFTFFKIRKYIVIFHKEEITEEVEEIEELKIPLPPTITQALSLQNFTVKHGKNLVLQNVDFTVKRGELVCLLGPSGTGKSSIIEAIVGRKTPTKGNITIFDKSIKDKEVYAHVGFVPQHPELYMNQTSEQNLLSSATKWGLKNAKKSIDGVLETIGLSHRKGVKASQLSGGQLKLLSLGMELMREPELLVLDEPTTGLDPNTRDNIITILSRLVTKKGKTVFFTTHFMDDAEGCDEVIIISDAKIVAQGTPSKLEKRLPGQGKVINIVLDNITEDLLKKIKKIAGVLKVISEGRNIKIIMEEPNAVKLAHKIDEIGGVVNKTEVTNATMKEVFVYHTGKEVEG